MDASFVHLDSVKTPLSALNQAETLLKVTEGNVVEEGIWLCVDCLDRAARALEADSERLGHECQAYNSEVKAQQERLRALERTLTNGMFPPSFDEPQDSVIERIESAFENEIALLLQAISQQEEELAHLKQLKKEQEEISIELDEMEVTMANEENALQLEARAMSHTQNQLTSTLQIAEMEIEKLAAVDLSLFSLVIDKRGLRYPLINEFRLAFCPKGDLGWDEIQVAWSQVAQLLLSMSLHAKEWRIIPLTTCAKLIHEKRVYNLGKDMSSMSGALKSLIRMLHSTQQELPFQITEDRIGDVLFPQLPNTDHPGWSRVVHYLACNLQHLSNAVSQGRCNMLQALLL